MARNDARLALEVLQSGILTDPHLERKRSVGEYVVRAAFEHESLGPLVRVLVLDAPRLRKRLVTARPLGDDGSQFLGLMKLTGDMLKEETTRLTVGKLSVPVHEPTLRLLDGLRPIPAFAASGPSSAAGGARGVLDAVFSTTWKKNEEDGDADNDGWRVTFSAFSMGGALVTLLALLAAAAPPEDRARTAWLQRTRLVPIGAPRSVSEEAGVVLRLRLRCVRHLVTATRNEDGGDGCISLDPIVTWPRGEGLRPLLPLRMLMQEPVQQKHRRPQQQQQQRDGQQHEWVESCDAEPAIAAAGNSAMLLKSSCGPICVRSAGTMLFRQLGSWLTGGAAARDLLFLHNPSLYRRALDADLRHSIPDEGGECAGDARDVPELFWVPPGAVEF